MKSLGATLLELLLVLGIGAMIILASLQLMRGQTYDMSAKKLQQSIELTFALMNTYYLGNEPESDTAQPHCLQSDTLASATLPTLALWATSTGSYTPQEMNLIQNPLGGQLAIAFLPTDVTDAQGEHLYYIYKFQVSASFPALTVAQVQQLQKTLNADTDSLTANKMLNWTRMPGQQLGHEIDSVSVASENLSQKLIRYDPNFQIPSGRGSGATGLPCPP